jgi:hypothetical protein
MRTFAFVVVAIIISIISCTCGYTVGCRNGYIHALIDKMNNIQPKYILKEKEDKQVVWTEDLNYNGISRAIRKGNLSE